MQIRINIALKKAVLDTQGKAIEGSLNKNLGYSQISNVRQGKFVDIEIKWQGLISRLSEPDLIHSRLDKNMVLILAGLVFSNDTAK